MSLTVLRSETLLFWSRGRVSGIPMLLSASQALSYERAWARTWLWIFRTLSQARVVCLVVLLGLTSFENIRDLLANATLNPSNASFAWPFRSSLSTDIKDLIDDLTSTEMMLEGRGRTTTSDGISASSCSSKL